MKVHNRHHLGSYFSSLWEHSLSGKGLLVLTISSLLLLTYFLSTFFILILFAFVIASVLRPISRLLTFQGINSLGATLIPFLGFVLLATLIVALSLPVGHEQINDLAELVTSLNSQSFSSKLELSSNSLSFLNSSTIEQLVNAQYHKTIIHFLNSSLSFIVEIITSIPYLIVLLFLAFFFLKDEFIMKRALLKNVPNTYYEFAVLGFSKILPQIDKYFRINFLVVISTSFFFAIIFTLLDIPYSLLLAAFAGLGTTIPYLGIIITAIPILLISYSSLNPAITFVLIGAFSLVHFSLTVFFNRSLTFLKSTFHPVTIFLLLVLAYTVWGFWGIFFILPIAHCVRLVVQEINWGAQNFQFTKDMLF